MTSSRDDLTAALAAYDVLYGASGVTRRLVAADVLADAARALLAEDPPDRPPTAGEVLAVGRRLKAEMGRIIAEDGPPDRWIPWADAADDVLRAAARLRLVPGVKP